MFAQMILAKCLGAGRITKL